MKFVLKGPINNIPALVQVWRRSGDKPYPEQMMFNLLTHICITRPQWVNPYTHWMTKIMKCLIKVTLKTDNETRYLTWFVIEWTSYRLQQSTAESICPTIYWVKDLQSSRIRITSNEVYFSKQTFEGELGTVSIYYHKNKNIERHTAHTVVSWPNPKLNGFILPIWWW